MILNWQISASIFFFFSLHPFDMRNWKISSWYLQILDIFNIFIYFQFFSLFFLFLFPSSLLHFPIPLFLDCFGFCCSSHIYWINSILFPTFEVAKSLYYTLLRIFRIVSGVSAFSIDLLIWWQFHCIFIVVNNNCVKKLKKNHFEIFD